MSGSVAQHKVLAPEAGFRYHRRTTTRGLKSNWEVRSAFVVTCVNGKTFFFLWFLWFFKDYKPEVPSHNSFESQLCGTLKNPHARHSSSSCVFFSPGLIGVTHYVEF